jgi:hypothetical protein
MYFDVLMPTILFIVTFAAMILSRKAEKKLKATVEEREFKNRDVTVLVVMIAVAVSIVMFVPSMAIMALFLFSYSSLLYTVSYAFSDMRRKRLNLFCGVFIGASVLAGAAGFFLLFPIDLRIYGTIAFAGFAAISFLLLNYAQMDQNGKPKWYLGALPPVMFLLLFGFFNSTPIWFPYLLDVYGILFAMLIVMYLGSLFSWRTVFIFAGFLTAMDIVLVWGTQTMVQAAEQVSGLGLPVLVAFPTIPFITTQGGLLIMRLGLGDFFFSGILGTQTWKKFGRKTAALSLLAICISFALFELILLNPELGNLLPVRALPATLPIVLGWLPVVLVKVYQERKNKPKAQPDVPVVEAPPASPVPENSTPT